MKITIKTGIVLLIIVALVVPTLFIVLNQGSGGNITGMMTQQKIQQAYAFARASPEKLDDVPCFCGCMQHIHDGRLHKRGLLDCFMKNDGSYEPHASQCDMCINDALEVQSLSSQGLSKDQIKARISSKYVR